MSDVSVIGLGAMGSAIARALLRGGNHVTVWNRTSTKAEPLVREGAVVAANPSSAISASPVIIVCVDNYQVTREILSGPDILENLSGRTLVQLSTGIPQEARDAEHRVRENGAKYLDGAILAYPDQMGTPEAALLIAGSDATFRSCEPLLRSIAGGLMYVGEQIGAASALDCASLSFLIGGLMGFLHGARICEIEDLRVDEFGSMLAELMPVVGNEVRQLSERIQANRYEESQAALRTYSAAAMRLVQHARESNIDGDLPKYTADALGRAVSAGFGNEDLAAFIKVLRGGA